MPQSVVTLAPVRFRARAQDLVMKCLSYQSCPGATYDAQRQALLRSSRGQGRFSAFRIPASFRLSSLHLQLCLCVRVESSSTG